MKNANLSLLKVLREDLSSAGAPDLSLLSMDGLVHQMQVAEMV